MRVVSKDLGAVTLELTRDELRIVSNAINEICNGPDAIEGDEFDTRVGASLSEAEALLGDLQQAF